MDNRCPGCDRIPEMVRGQWWPHDPGQCRNLEPAEYTGPDPDAMYDLDREERGLREDFL